jgi:hypothetical protein
LPDAGIPGAKLRFRRVAGRIQPRQFGPSRRWLIAKPGPKLGLTLPTLGARFAEARTDHDDAWDTAVGALLQNAQHLGCGHGNHDNVDWLVHVQKTWPGGEALDEATVSVHGHDSPRESARL